MDSSAQSCWLFVSRNVPQCYYFLRVGGMEEEGVYDITSSWFGEILTLYGRGVKPGVQSTSTHHRAVISYSRTLNNIILVDTRVQTLSAFELASTRARMCYSPYSLKQHNVLEDNISRWFCWQKHTTCTYTISSNQDQHFTAHLRMSHFSLLETAWNDLPDVIQGVKYYHLLTRLGPTAALSPQHNTKSALHQTGYFQRKRRQLNLKENVS